MDMTTDAATTQTTFAYDYYFDYGDEYMYPGYKFERPVYLYLWEILVIVTAIQNLLVLSVFMRRKMRNPTNIILSAIAISDSLTGLVTLPTYIMVFQRYDPLPVPDYEEIYYEHNLTLSNNLHSTDATFNQSHFNSKNLPFYSSVDPSSLYPTTTISSSSVVNATETSSSSSTSSTTTNHSTETHSPLDGYTLSKDLCRGFMISKYFFSKSFHTISIFLTLFLEIQRYISMAYPYRYETCCNKFRIVKIYCISIFVLCPFLHAYHLGSEKATGGMCQWELPETGCGKDCIYLWIAFIVRHFIPCVILVIITVLFILQLRKGEKSFRRMDSNSSQYSRRVHENRRITFIVTTVVIVRLIPEIPYSIFLLFNSIDVTFFMGKDIDLETNRIFHMCYELCLICSFLASLYIYLIFNKSFRKRLYRTFIEPVRKQFDVSLRLHEFQSSHTTRRLTLKFADSVKPGEEIEMKTAHSESPGKLVKIRT